MTRPGDLRVLEVPQPAGGSLFLPQYKSWWGRWVTFQTTGDEGIYDVGSDSLISCQKYLEGKAVAATEKVHPPFRKPAIPAGPPPPRKWPRPSGDT